MSTDDYIVITESRDTNDDGAADMASQKQGDGSSKRVLEEQGIFLDQKSIELEEAEPSNEFAKELQKSGGIEIMPSEPEDTSTN